MSVSSPNEDLAGEGLIPPPFELRQFNPSANHSVEDTDCLLNLWHALQRSAADAALATEPDRNVFAFQSGCLYFATIHDPLFRQKLEKENLAKEVAEQNKLKDESARRASLLDQAKGDLRQFIQRQETLSAPNSEGIDRHSSGFSQWNATNTTTRGYNPGANDGSAGETVAQTNAWPEPYLNTISPEEEIHGWPSSHLDDLPNATPEVDVPINMPKSDFFGIVYLLAPAPGSAPASCEASLGIAIIPQMRGQGFGPEVVRRVLAIAFDDFLFHRVSVGVLAPSTKPRANFKPQMDTTGKGKMGPVPAEKARTLGTETETEAALRMFVGVGFTIEGLRRRAVPDTDDNGEWRDAHFLAMLDTDWLAIKRAELSDIMQKNAFTKGKGRAQDKVDTKFDGSVKKRTRWDEMLARHQREQEALAGAESRLKRSASTETLRPGGGIDAEMLPDNSTITSASASASEAGADLHSERASVRSYVSDPFSDSARPVPYGSTDHLIAKGAYGILDADIDMESDYGEETAKSKVARYLSALSQHEPPPPPSSTGSVSDFESCADEADLLSRATLNEVEGPQGASADGSPSRKKRRLSPEVTYADSDTGNSIGGAATPLEVREHTGADQNDSDMDPDSDVETASISTWDVLSGSARSPSPSPSLSSGTGSLSLQSVSENEAE